MEVGTHLLKGIGRVPGVRAGRRAARSVSAWVRVAADFRRFRDLSQRRRPAMTPAWRERMFMLENRTADTPFDRHYVYHTAWALRRLAEHRPEAHVDVSSSLYFVALGSAVIPMVHFDYRPPRLELSRLECRAGDLNALPLPTSSVESLSCLHVLEHVGLGRYGDPLDVEGDLKGARELARVLRPGGRLYFAAPAGRRRVVFNAHRVYDAAAIRGLFPDLAIEESALVPDDPALGLIANPSDGVIDAQEYGCACVVFRKSAA